MNTTDRIAKLLAVANHPNTDPIVAQIYRDKAASLGATNVDAPASNEDDHANYTGPWDFRFCGDRFNLHTDEELWKVVILPDSEGDEAEYLVVFGSDVDEWALYDDFDFLVLDTYKPIAV